MVWRMDYLAVMMKLHFRPFHNQFQYGLDTIILEVTMDAFLKNIVANIQEGLLSSK